jgi:hypothetical protein
MSAIYHQEPRSAASSDMAFIAHERRGTGVNVVNVSECFEEAEKIDQKSFAL